MLANLTKKEILDFDGAKMSEMYGKLDTALLMKYMQTLQDRPMALKFIADERGEWDECAKFKDITPDIISYLLNEHEDYYNRWEYAWCCKKMGARMDEIKDCIPLVVFKFQKKEYQKQQRKKKAVKPIPPLSKDRGILGVIL
jgi:hypothetical protein